MVYIAINLNAVTRSVIIIPTGIKNTLLPKPHAPWIER